MELSFSRFRIYRECPWKYKLQFVDGRKPPLDAPASLGLSLHRALERYHGGEDLLEAYEAEFLRSGYPDAETRQRWKRKGERMLETFLERDSGRRSELLGAEREFVFTLGRHTVRGMIDRLDRRPDGTIELVDYKTRFGLDPRDPSPPPEESDLQLRFYALGAKEGLGLTPSLLSVHYLAADRVESRPYDPSGEERLKAEIIRVADAIEAAGASHDFKPDTSFCPRCVYRRECKYSVAKI